MNKYVGSDFDELQLEREAHRKTWRQLEQVTGLLRRWMSDEALDNPHAIYVASEAALSQQAEPAPAQDEREAFANRFPESTNCTRLADVREGWIAGLEYAAHPAQTAPQCNHRFMYFGDQKKRRCADCCVVEGSEHTASQPEQNNES